jgi:hypothetical protein
MSKDKCMLKIVRYMLIIFSLNIYSQSYNPNENNSFIHPSNIQDDPPKPFIYNGDTFIADSSDIGYNKCCKECLEICNKMQLISDKHCTEESYLKCTSGCKKIYRKETEE